MHLNFRIFVICVFFGTSFSCIQANTLANSQQNMYDQSLFDAMLMSWIGSNASINFRLNQRVDSKSLDKADIWADLMVGTSNFGSRVHNLFGFYSGIDKKYGEHLVMGVGLGYVRGSNEVQQSFSNSAQYLLANIYARILSAHNELDMSIYGVANFKEVRQQEAGSVQQSRYNPHGFGARVSYGYVLHINTAHLLKPSIGYNISYSHQPRLSQNGTLVFQSSTKDISFQTLEVGLEYRFKRASGSFLYIHPAYGHLISTHQNTTYMQSANTQAQGAQADFLLPQGFVSMLVGGEIVHKEERLRFLLNAYYKQAINAQNSSFERIGLNIFSIWGGVKFGF